jgi:O-antigen/teichoic acid export membrane protein
MRGLTRLSGLSVGLRVVRFLLGVGSSILLTRLLSVHDYGVFAYALVIAGLLAIPGEAGMPNLVLREIARARDDQDIARVRGLARFAALTVLGLSLAMAALAALLLWMWQAALPKMLLATLAAALPALLLGALANTRAAVQRALGAPIASQLPEQVVRPAALIACTLLLWAATG